MIPLFDILKMEKDGSLRWCETADTLEGARSRAKVLTESAQAHYVIVNHQTGHKVIVGRSGPISAPEPPKSHGKTHGWYHICWVDKEKLRWVEAAETLQIAEARIKSLKTSHPGDYLVLDYDPESYDYDPSKWAPLACVVANYFISSVRI